ncbi:copper homeostasis protein CutC [Facilibium subflavum]|uniref:copper homeostasis protein CutC n=1 Tax=Facilibium subflavum TaxID=2219058 RepID=UPI000E649255|nr:copper homeostasis protein CutC [Facilibium subflavum]
MNIEVCVDNTESIDITCDFAIDRLELCSALGLDGLTPSVALVRYAKRHSNASCHAMIRPRAGDFVYNDTDFQLMLDEIHILAACGIDGIVFGCLNQDQTIATDKLSQVMKLAREYRLQTTFHRAIDLTCDYLGSIQCCVDLGVDRILTSGAADKAYRGMRELKKAVDCFSGKIEIMAGSGIHSENVCEIITTGVDAVHFSASHLICKTHEVSAFPASSLTYQVTDVIKLKQLIKTIMLVQAN